MNMFQSKLERAFQTKIRPALKKRIMRLDFLNREIYINKLR